MGRKGSESTGPTRYESALYKIASKMIVPVAVLFLVSQAAAAGMPGGLSPADVNSEKVKEMAQFALTTYDAENGGLPKTILEILQAQTQVVAGVNYFLKVKVSNAEGLYNCDFTVFDQPWTNTRRLTSSNCKEVVV